ncbi:MAG: tRNA (guanosine(46)-N7)-methyltransferase TrmB [Thermoanaerobaculales bacterium]|nr:tRNA (guanosine(46)-N7)-methyltransferase TrmB [Thermoanaerobaculales bacterium]
MTVELDLNRVAIPLDWPEIFGRTAPVDLEIGAGKGRFLLERAAAAPDRSILAVERALAYHRLCCERAARRGLANVRLLRTSAEDLLYRLLAPSSVETVFILFPDPWPKKRHHKRRLITPEAVAALHRALAAGGRLLVKTDHEAYAGVIAGILADAPGFTPLEPAVAFAGLPLTGFEHKYRDQGRTIFPFALEKTD